MAEPSSRDGGSHYRTFSTSSQQQSSAQLAPQPNTPHNVDGTSSFDPRRPTNTRSSTRPHERATSVWFDELRQVEAAGDAAFNRRRVPLFERSKRPHVFSEEERKRMNSYESIDYIEPQSLVYKDHLRVVRTEHARWLKWVVYIAVGGVVGIWACLLFQTLDLLSDLKKEAIEDVIRDKIHSMGSNRTDAVTTAGGIYFDAYLEGYVVYVLWAACAALLSSLCCVVMPSAAGSGVPDVMAYLNGVMFPRIFNIRNLVIKTVSCILGVSSGLPVGAEGPMIHIGALIGAGLPTGRSRSLKCSATSLLSLFRNTKDHRDFISAGAACGVTSAFSSPIGGLLFVMEEVATFFPVKLAWMVFVSCLACMFTMQLVNSYVVGWRPTHYLGEDEGNFADSAITLFRVDYTGAPRVPMSLYTFGPTFVVAIYMGVLSIVFVVINLRISRLRARVIFPRMVLRVLEPCLFVILYASVCYFTPLAFGCEDLTSEQKTRLDDLGIHLWTAFCEKPDTQFHPLGTLTLTNSYNVLRLLFSRNTTGMLPWHSLLLLHVIYTSGACIASGMFLSSGVVIPTLVMGASGGRLLGVFFQNSMWADPGVISLIGAASYFGGLSRLTFSLIVIMMEITNDLTHLPALMAGIIVSATIADRFCHSLYHAILEMKCVPFLEVQTTVHKLDTFCAKDIMSTPVVSLRTTETMSHVFEVLSTTSHHCFPIVSVSDGKEYRGLLQRRQLELLLWFIYLRDVEGHSFQRAANAKSHASYQDLQLVQEKIFWSRLSPMPSPATFPQEMLEGYLDLNPYVDSSALYVRDVMCLSRTYYIFRNMGVRHLPVLNRRNEVVGLITRKNLVGDRMHERIEAAAIKAKEFLRNQRQRRRRD